MVGSAFHAFEADEETGCPYPSPWEEPAEERRKRRLGDTAGLTHFGVNQVTLDPGVWSSQRHWHSHEDEFIYVLEGTLTLVTDEGEQTLTAGMCAGFPAGEANGHHLINLTGSPALYLEIGDRPDEDVVIYSDIDMMKTEDGVFRDRRGNTLERSR